MGVPPIEVGLRIHCDGEYGTVLYVGPLEEMKGNWLGIEWDNPTRGKHSGSIKSVCYFKTSIPNAGSFIKISKADLGITCPQAIKIKYGKDKEASFTPSLINLPQKSGTTRHVEIIGMQKIAQKQCKFAQLTDIALSGMLISGPGELRELNELIPNVRDLDLSQNLLPSWDVVSQIVKQLPRLSTLILSRNRLTLPKECSCHEEDYFCLKMLVLNNMNYDWNEILQIACLWPCVEHLCLLDNRITKLATPSISIFSDLRILNLDNNHIRKWSEVCKLGSLINLEELHLDNTHLEEIQFPDVDPSSKTCSFPNLQILFIRNNQLKEWRDISELNKLRGLRSLMLKNNPVILTVDAETGRQMIIAKVQQLHILNRTKIEKSERRGAEIDYLKRYHIEWKKSEISREFAANHPTYATLLEKHGAPDESEVKAQSFLIKDNLICVQIFSPLLPDRPVISRKLPAEMTVGKLKALVQRLFKVAAHEVTITRVFNEDESQRTVMDNNLRQLSFYSISDQDKIAVEWG